MASKNASYPQGTSGCTPPTYNNTMTISQGVLKHKFLQAERLSCRPTNNVEALKAEYVHITAWKTNME